MKLHILGTEELMEDLNWTMGKCDNYEKDIISDLIKKLNAGIISNDEIVIELTFYSELVELLDALEIADIQYKLTEQAQFLEIL